MSQNDELQAAYERISGRFPADADVRLSAQVSVGRRKSHTFKTFDYQGKAAWNKTVKPFYEMEFDLYVTVDGESFYEEVLGLEEIDAAATAVLRQIQKHNGTTIVGIPMRTATAAR